LGQLKLLEALVDNDIVEKMARWSCIGDFPASLSIDTGSVAYLQSLRFVVGERLKALRPTVVYDRFEEFLTGASPVEPTEPEIDLAATIESISQQDGLDLDVGESLLIAVAIARKLRKVATGDKRAICSCPALVNRIREVESLRGCFISLEQILARLLSALGAESLRLGVCSDADADKTARICFACSQCQISDQDILQALASYQADLAKKSDYFSCQELGC